MIPKRSNSNGKWVIVLTVCFAVLAVGVFSFAIWRHRSRSTRDDPAPDEPPPATPTEPMAIRVVRVVDGDSMTVVGADGIELSPCQDRVALIRIQGGGAV